MPEETPANERAESHADPELLVQASYVEIEVIDRATCKAALAIFEPYIREHGLDHPVPEMQTDGAARPAQREVSSQDYEDVDISMSLDHKNPFHLQWAYETTGGSVGNAASYFDVSRTTVRDNLHEAGIHDPDAVEGEAGYRDPDLLEDVFTAKNRNIEETADSFGVSVKTIRNWLNRHGISQDPGYQDPDKLERVYLDNDLEVEATAAAFGASPTTIRRWLRRFDLLDGGDDADSQTVQENEESGSQQKGDDEEEDVPCDEPKCDRAFGSERAKNIHKAKAHEDDDEEDEPEPVDPPGDDPLDDGDSESEDSEHGEYNIDQTEIRTVDVAEYGYPYTTGNLAEKIATADGFYEMGRSLDVSRAEAHRLCERLNIADQIASGVGVEKDEIQRRLEIASDSVSHTEGSAA